MAEVCTGVSFSRTISIIIWQSSPLEWRLRVRLVQLSDITMRSGERGGSPIDASIISVSLRHGCVCGSHELDSYTLLPTTEREIEDSLKRRLDINTQELQCGVQRQSRCVGSPTL